VDHSGFPGKIFEDLPQLVVEVDGEEKVAASTSSNGKEEVATARTRRRRRGRIEGGRGGDSVVMAEKGGDDCLMSVLSKHKLPLVLGIVFLLAFFLLNVSSGF
jgi:hypothetical protein